MFSREHREIETDGRLSFVHDASSLEKATRLAVFSYLDAVRHRVAYYGPDPELTQGKIDSVAAAIDSVSVLIDRHIESPEGDDTA